MGGHDHGEIASRTVANALGEYLDSCSTVDIPTFEAALSKAYDALDALEGNFVKKPGTTMTCLCLNEDSYIVAHIGDSRIYHVRPSLFNPTTGRGGIIYQSSDHSLVNDLLKAGELTEEEAKVFPQKNVITRAMQPNLEKRYKADVFKFQDIKPGDYFFLCSDGVLEQMSNEKLCEILANPKLSDQEKITSIKAVCDGNTRDNYTCWLVPIDKVKITAEVDDICVIQAVAEDSTPEVPLQKGKCFWDRHSFMGVPSWRDVKKFSVKNWCWILSAVVVMVLLIGGYLLYKKHAKATSHSQPVLEIEEVVNTINSVD